MRLFSGPKMLIAMLGASVIVPYTVGNAPRILEQISPQAARRPGAPGVPAEEGAGGDGLHANDDPAAVLYPSLPLEGPPAVHLEEVFRFDVTKDWIYLRWPRKSTSLANDDLFGIRVPLVTGISIDDLAGSLTYYFNPAGQVQHIAFRGRTGDPQRLVRLLAGRYGLRPQNSPVPGEQLYQTRWNGRPQSELRIRPAAVVWSSSPHSTFDVVLALERPGSNRFL